MSEKHRSHQWEIRAAGKSQCHNCGIIMLRGDMRDAIWYSNCTKPTPPASQESAGEAVLPRITAEDRDFLHYNPNTDDVVDWVQNYARLHAAALTAELVEVRAELEKETAQSKHLAEAMSRKIQDLIAAENQCSYYKGQYTRCEQVRKEACEANIKAQAKTLWLEDELAEAREQRDSLRDECERLRGSMVELVSQFDKKQRVRRIDAPGHSHWIPGVWDSDNGELAGEPCALCAVWREACAIHDAALSASGREDGK